MSSAYFDLFISQKLFGWKANIETLGIGFLFYGYQMYLIHIQIQIQILFND